MKLLLFINSLSAGGAERVMSKLADYFVSEGNDVTLLTQTPLNSDHYPTQAKRRSLDSGQISRHPLHALVNNLRRLSRLRHVIDEEQPDVILAFMPTANVLALMAARRTRTPVVVSERVHPPFLDLSPIRRRLQHRYYPHAAKVVVLSQVSATWFKAHLRITNTTVIPNSITLPLPRHEPCVEPADVVADDTPMVLNIGRLVEQKQPEIVLDTFAASTREPWHLVMIGSGVKADLLRDRAKQLGIAQRFTLLPRVGNVQDWYERASIYLSASSYEGFPNALLEAMACSCACIAFDCPTGPSDLIEHEHNGMLIPLGDREGLAAALNSLSTDPTLRQRIALAAGATADTFSDASILPRWMSVLSEARG